MRCSSWLVYGALLFTVSFMSIWSPLNQYPDRALFVVAAFVFWRLRSAWCVFRASLIRSCARICFFCIIACSLTTPQMYSGAWSREVSCFIKVLWGVGRCLVSDGVDCEWRGGWRKLLLFSWLWAESKRSPNISLEQIEPAVDRIHHSLQHQNHPPINLNGIWSIFNVRRAGGTKFYYCYLQFWDCWIQSYLDDFYWCTDLGVVIGHPSKSKTQRGGEVSKAFIRLLPLPLVA